MTNQKINKLKRWWMSEEIHKSEWIFMIFIGVLTLVMFRYADLESFTGWSVNFWDTLFAGNISDFYGYSAQNAIGVPSIYCGSSIFPILVLAICNFPIWLAKTFAGCNLMTSFGAMLYAKMVLVAFFVGTLAISTKICKKIGMTKQDILYMIFLSSSSLFVYSALGYCGQNDIVDIFFCMLAIYSLLKKQNGLFIFLMAVSIAFKPFTLFIFLPILMLVEKNIFKIIVKTVITMSFSAFWYVIYFNQDSFWVSMHKNSNEGLLKGMVESTTFAVSLGTISLFFFSYIIILFVCYITQHKNEEELIKNICYYSFAAMCSYFMFCGFEPYRIIMLFPFMYILIGLNKEIRLLNIILEFFINIAYFIFATYTFFWCYSSNRMDHMLITKIFGTNIQYDASYKTIYDMFGLGNVLTILNTIFFVAMAIILFINHPKSKIQINTNYKYVSRSLFWLRSFIIIPFLLLSILLYYYK